MFELNDSWPAIVGVMLSVFMAWIVSRDKLSRHQVDTLAREIAKEAVNPFTGQVQQIEAQWHETFERLKLQEGRIAARLRKEDKLLAARADGDEVDDLLAGAKVVQAGKNLAESNGTRQAEKDALLKKFLAGKSSP